MKTNASPWTTGHTFEIRVTSPERLYDFKRPAAPSAHDLLLAPAGEGMNQFMAKLAANTAAAASD